MAKKMTKRQYEEAEYQSFRFSVSGSSRQYRVVLSAEEKAELEKMVRYMLPARTSFPAIAGMSAGQVMRAKRWGSTRRYIAMMTKQEMRTMDRMIRFYVEKKKKNSPLGLVTAAWALHNALKTGAVNKGVK